MKLFENSSKAEDNQKELETAQLRAQAEQERLEFEKARQESLEKKLDELILVGKAVYTILKQEREDREAAYERMENLIQQTTSELLSNQEKAVKVLLKYNQDDRQKLANTINEEVVKVQAVVADGQKQLTSAAEELNNSILENTKVLNYKLDTLEDSIKNMNISVASVPVTAEVPMAAMPTEEMIDDIIAGLEMDDEAAEEDALAVMDSEIEFSESVEDIVLDIPEHITEEVFAVVDEEEVPVEEDIISILESEDELELEVEIPEIEEDVFAVLEDEDELVISEPEVEAPVSEDLFAMLEEEEEIELPEPEPVAPAPAPVIDDPNRAMTPDEIAALIASVNGGNSAKEEAPVPEAEEIPEPEPVAPAPAPVMDDPNRAMTPDEIAALIASMN